MTAQAAFHCYWGQKLKYLGLDATHSRTVLSVLRKAVDGALKRLRTDHIDLLYQHLVKSDRN